MAGRFACLWRWLAMAFFLLAATASGAHAEKRVALVIGNPPIAGRDSRTPNDATLMSDTLMSLGFSVVGGGAQLDLDKAGFDDAMHRFGRSWSAPTSRCSITPAMARGSGPELPGPRRCQAGERRRPPAGNWSMFPAFGSDGELGLRVDLVLLDACRDNPFRGRAWLRPPWACADEAPAGTLISFATQPRSMSLDGDDGHSPYTRALTRTMRIPAMACSTPSTKSGSRWRSRPMAIIAVGVVLADDGRNFYFAGSPDRRGSNPLATVTPPCRRAVTPVRCGAISHRL